MADRREPDGRTGSTRQRFPGISSRTYEHPADRTALTALRTLQGFDTALRKISGLVGERSLRLMHLGSAVRVGPQQFTTIHDMTLESAQILDLAQTPEVFVVNQPHVGAMALGMDRPFIVLNTATVDLMTPDELQFVIGHEVGHVASGHAVYRTLLYHLLQLASRVAWIPLGVLGVRAIVAALEEWARKSELSADRAGLLVVQDPDVALRALMKLAGGAHLAEMDVDAFLDQAAEYDGSGDVRDSVLKLLALQGQTHPFAVLRAAELHKWASSAEYQQVLAGDYPLRADDAQTRISDEVRSATRSYAESVRETADPLVSMVRDAAGASSRWFQRFGSDGSSSTGQAPDGDAPASTPRRPASKRPPAKTTTAKAPAAKATAAKRSTATKKTTAAKKATPAKKSAATTDAAVQQSPAKKAPGGRKTPSKRTPRKGTPPPGSTDGGGPA